MTEKGWVCQMAGDESLKALSAKTLQVGKDVRRLTQQVQLIGTLSTFQFCDNTVKCCRSNYILSYIVQEAKLFYCYQY